MGGLKSQLSVKICSDHNNINAIIQKCLQIVNLSHSIIFGITGKSIVFYQLNALSAVCFRVQIFYLHEM